LKSYFHYRKHRVFIARLKLQSTSQRYTILESTAMSFTPRQDNWDYRHEHERRKYTSLKCKSNSGLAALAA